jgi:hypothetical protein
VAAAGWGDHSALSTMALPLLALVSARSTANIRRFLCCLSLVCLVAPADAQLDAVRYNIGATEFIETKDELVVHLSDTPPIRISQLAGGKFWPPVIIDETGKIYLGDKTIDSKSATVAPDQSDPNEIRLNASTSISTSPDFLGFIFRRGNKICRLSLNALGIHGKKDPASLLKDSNFNVAVASDGAVLALITHFDRDDTVGGYGIGRIDVSKCAVMFNVDIGNPDLLIEFGWSRDGKWWITGSNEQTLLRSPDGRNWISIALPDNIYSLISSYVVNDREIWLAAGLASTADSDDYMLVYSGDGGQTWSGINKHDPLLKNIPPYWLEGIRRRSQPAQ